MTEEKILMREVIHDHRERMGNIRKYYPYFKLMETDFSNYQDGKYDCLDMGYLLMAVLRFFIEENSFKEKDVTYEEYSSFMSEIYERDFGLKLEKAEEQSLSSYIFDKLRNEGRPFLFSYFHPEERKKKTVRIRLIDSKIKEDKIYYYLTGEAIEFYLETKEVRDESKINLSQLLLSKMIASKNFKGGIEVVRRMNHQVKRLKMQKDEVLRMLGSDVFSGIQAYEEFMTHGTKWFHEEQKMFAKNMELIEEALKRADGESYGETIREISLLEQELKHALVNHSELLNECTKLQGQADELIARAKFSKLKRSFDFEMAAGEMLRKGDATVLEALLQPLWKLHPQKTMPLFRVEELLTLRMGREEKAEMVEEAVQEVYVTEDEREEERIGHNFAVYLRILLYYISVQEAFDVEMFGNYIEEVTGEAVWNQSDFYALLTHLAQKEVYHMEECIKAPDTFLEEYLAVMGRENPQYKKLHFRLDFEHAEELQTKQGYRIWNVRIERGDKT